MLNKSFFLMALTEGLSAAIMNPYSCEMMSAYHTYRALSGLDESFQNYIAFADKAGGGTSPVTPVNPAQNFTLTDAIVKGLGELATTLAREKLDTIPPLTLINEEIIPALNIVGEGFEKGRVYLPGLLMSAEAAKCAFECVKERMPKGESKNRATVVMATVKGDIHDIGKNIVKLLLENFGFRVIDLGRDVSADTVADAVVSSGAQILGLSALMTTTVPAMEETVKLVRARSPKCKIMVGGAVLTEEYAAMIGADAYAKDAMGAVRIAEEMSENLK
jgi:5-methyltetrahydrofolate--homocysteine methyltransferase